MLNGVASIGLALIWSLFAASPSSTNYTLKAYDFGSGGGTSTSTSYKVNAILNGQSGDTASSTSYKVSPGLLPTQHANVPPAPTFSNPSNYYNRLQMFVNTGSNPSTTKFAIAISSDNFATTLHIQPDNTIGSSFSLSNYQTYTSWGGASGFLVLGLQANTTYKTKIKALNGNFTETAYGPTASASTVWPSITFSVTTTLSATPPFNMSFSNLAPGSVYSADADTLISLSTNAVYGGTVYVAGTNNGLKSNAASYTISSLDGDLSSLATGYGAQVISSGQSSGGPFNPVSPYNGTGDNVGSLYNSLSAMLSTANPVTSGSATVRIKAKTSTTVPSSNDYSDILSFIAAMIF